MAQGPGRPNSAQRPIFGGGNPVFAQMPTYTPVTRGPDQAPLDPQQRIPEPPPPSYGGYRSLQNYQSSCNIKGSCTSCQSTSASNFSSSPSSKHLEFPSKAWRDLADQMPTSLASAQSDPDNNRSKDIRTS